MNRQTRCALGTVFSAALAAAALSGCAGLSTAGSASGGLGQGGQGSATTGTPLTLPSALATGTVTTPAVDSGNGGGNGGSTSGSGGGSGGSGSGSGSSSNNGGGNSGGGAPASLPICNSQGLLVTVFVVAGSQGMGHESLNVTLINADDPTCSVYGFPGFQLMGENQDDQPGADQPTTVTWDPAVPKTLITLTPTAEASTTVRFDDDIPVGNESTSGGCEPESYYLAVMPPNNTSPVIQRIGGPMATLGLTVCEHGTLDVLAFVPGGTGPNQ